MNQQCKEHTMNDKDTNTMPDIDDRLAAAPHCMDFVEMLNIIVSCEGALPGASRVSRFLWRPHCRRPLSLLANAGAQASRLRLRPPIPKAAVWKA